MRLLLVAWLVARPVAGAATACLYAHGDGQPARALTCVSVLPPAAAATVAGSGGEGRTPVARCSRRWLLSQACRDGGTGPAAEAVALVDAPRGDGIRERRLAGTYVVEHGVCRRAAAAPPEHEHERGRDRARVRAAVRGRARVPRVELARGDRGVLAPRGQRVDGRRGDAPSRLRERRRRRAGLRGAGRGRAR